MKPLWHYSLLAGLLLFALADVASASLIATDNASDAIYNPNWDNGDNGGSGFQAWTAIGNGVGGGFGGGFRGTGNTDIGTGGSNDVFGVFGNGGGVGQATRPFTGALSVGQTFYISMDNQGIDSGGTVGFGLRNSSSANRFEFFFVGGQANYTVLDNSGAINTGVGYTTAGLDLVFTLTGTNTYSFIINGGSPITGTLMNTGGVDRVRLFNANGGPDAFFNSLAIVPEPASGSLFGFAALVLTRFRRQCQS